MKKKSTKPRRLYEWFKIQDPVDKTIIISFVVGVLILVKLELVYFLR